MAGQVGAEARRLRKPGWKDPRLLVGILLVAGSVAGTVGLSPPDRTMPMYVAKEDISLVNRSMPPGWTLWTSGLTGPGNTIFRRDGTGRGNPG